MKTPKPRRNTTPPQRTIVLKGQQTGHEWNRQNSGLTELPGKLLRNAILRTEFPSFCRRAFETLNDGAQLSDDPYIEVVIAWLERVFGGEVKRLIVNLPPRHGKTFLATVCLAAWEPAHQPAHKVLIVSYSEDLAREIAQAVRNLLRAEWFTEVFGSLIARDDDRAGDFGTTKGGRLFATSFGGGIIGHGADLIIVDDPSKPEDAGSPEQLNRVSRLFETAVLTRLNNPRLGRVVVVAHRIHDRDLSGVLLEEGGWEHLKLAFVAEQSAEYSLNDGHVWRRKAGELLRADAFSFDEVERRQKIVGPPDFATLYQQSPAQDRLGLTRDDFSFFDTLPYMDSGTVLSIDTAYGKGASSSHSVIQEWQSDPAGRHYLPDQWSGRVPFDELWKEVTRFVNRGRVGAILVEDTGVGNVLLAKLQKRGQPLVHGIRPVGSKLERLSSVRDVIKAGLVFLPNRAEWLPGFLEEVEEFPDGWSDDQVDAMSQYLVWATKNPPPPRPPGRTGGVLVTRHGPRPLPPAGTGFGRPGSVYVWSPRRR
jgi:predicted phage terminase large subunit-like protein